MSCCNSEILEAIDEFYKLKDKYESKINKEKQKILAMTSISKKEKQTKFNRIKKYCINCNREGGTIFSNKNRILKAICGVSYSPCKLNIEIQLGEYDSKINILNDEKINKENSELEIIKIKLKLLFNFIEESEAIKLYENEKKIYTENQVIYHSLLTDILMITDNPTKFKNINDTVTSLYQNIETLKQLHKIYYQNDNTNIIKEIIELYLKKIIPNTERIRNLTYNYYYIEENDDGTFELIQKPYTNIQLELNNGITEKIIKNNK